MGRKFLAVFLAFSLVCPPGYGRQNQPQTPQSPLEKAPTIFYVFLQDIEQLARYVEQRDPSDVKYIVDFQAIDPANVKVVDSFEKAALTCIPSEQREGDPLGALFIESEEPDLESRRRILKCAIKRIKAVEAGLAGNSQTHLTAQQQLAVDAKLEEAEEKIATAARQTSTHEGQTQVFDGAGSPAGSQFAGPGPNPGVKNEGTKNQGPGTHRDTKSRLYQGGLPPKPSQATAPEEQPQEDKKEQARAPSAELLARRSAAGGLEPPEPAGFGVACSGWVGLSDSRLPKLIANPALAKVAACDHDEAMKHLDETARSARSILERVAEENAPKPGIQNNAKTLLGEYDKIQEEADPEKKFARLQTWMALAHRFIENAKIGLDGDHGEIKDYYASLANYQAAIKRYINAALTDDSAKGFFGDKIFLGEPGAHEVAIVRRPGGIGLLEYTASGGPTFRSADGQVVVKYGAGGVANAYVNGRLARKEYFTQGQTSSYAEQCSFDASGKCVNGSTFIQSRGGVIKNSDKFTGADDIGQSVSKEKFFKKDGKPAGEVVKNLETGEVNAVVNTGYGGQVGVAFEGSKLETSQIWRELGTIMNKGGERDYSAIGKVRNEIIVPRNEAWARSDEARRQLSRFGPAGLRDGLDRVEARAKHEYKIVKREALYDDKG
ncbi:MAG: hypothetical protein AAB091_05415, partial [Elusimicrobiota bacterium]